MRPWNLPSLPLVLLQQLQCAAYSTPGSMKPFRTTSWDSPGLAANEQIDDSRWTDRAEAQHRKIWH